MRRVLRGLLIVVPIVLLLAVGGFVVWANAVPAPMSEAVAAMQSDSQVQYSKENWLVFRPTQGEPEVGLIFYPGGRVPAEAYTPAMHDIAADNYLAVIVPMPLNLAVLGVDRAKEVIAAYPEINRWVIAGHSLGGAMAARFAHDNPDLVDGLVLWASYPESSKDLSQSGLAAMSIYGTRDGVALPATIEASRPLLPDAAQWVAIEGGNHAQFGWYGAQAGDQEATITHEAQQAQTVTATLRVLDLVTEAE
jgi:pimeloyl-ACP methyl ester carboxylesterase